MNNQGLFTGKSDDYSRFRSSYPEAALDWLRERCSGEQVLDIGAGTGIFTRLLLPRFKEVSALEPNADMRQKFHELLPEVPCFDGTGESTGMKENSADLITVAQAFHWLDEERFKAEAKRILRSHGKAAVIWNTSTKSDFTTARDSVCRKFCPRFKKGYAGKRPVHDGDDFLRHRYFREVEFAAFRNPFSMDLIVFEGNIRSRSYALASDHPDYAAFMSELRSVFEAYAENGVVTELQETQIYLGEF